MNGKTVIHLIFFLAPLLHVPSHGAAAARMERGALAGAQPAGRVGARRRRGARGALAHGSQDGGPWGGGGCLHGQRPERPRWWRWCPALLARAGGEGLRAGGRRAAARHTRTRLLRKCCNEDWPKSKNKDAIHGVRRNPCRKRERKVRENDERAWIRKRNDM